MYLMQRQKIHNLRLYQFNHHVLTDHRAAEGEVHHVQVQAPECHQAVQEAVKDIQEVHLAATQDHGLDQVHQTVHQTGEFLDLIRADQDYPHRHDSDGQHLDLEYHAIHG